jgi:hypothetical protein
VRAAQASFAGLAALVFLVGTIGMAGTFDKMPYGDFTSNVLASGFIIVFVGLLFLSLYLMLRSLQRS